MAGGVAFIPAVPGLAPGACMWERVKGRGCVKCDLDGLASKRRARASPRTQPTFRLPDGRGVVHDRSGVVRPDQAARQRQTGDAGNSVCMGLVVSGIRLLASSSPAAQPAISPTVSAIARTRG